MHEGQVTFAVPDGEPVRAAAVRRARRHDPVGQRHPAEPRRRVPVLHRHDDPGRRGGRAPDRAPDRREAMSMTSRDTTGTGPPRGPDRPPAARSRSVLAHKLRATKVVWQREMIRFAGQGPHGLRAAPAAAVPVRARHRAVGSLVGTGGGIDFRTFLFPGVLATSVLFTAASPASRWSGTGSSASCARCWSRRSRRRDLWRQVPRRRDRRDRAEPGARSRWPARSACRTSR